VLRMIESFVGEEAFRGGVRIYLDRHAEGNATADDFWRALDEASGQNVTAIANNWIFEPGHPLVDWTAQADDGGLRVQLRQRRFFADPSAPPTDQRWLVPVVIKYGTTEGVREERLLLDAETATATLPGAQWYYPNAGGRGFYRYSLDDGSVRLLAQLGMSQLAPEERLMLVDNYWALVHAGRASLRQLFELLSGLRGEQDRAVLDSIADALAWLSTHAVSNASRPAFQGFVSTFFAPILDQLGWDVRAGESTEDREKRARALSILGRVAQDPAVIDGAKNRIDDYLAGNTQLDPDIASALAGVAAGPGDEALYQRYLARMRANESTDAQEEARFRNALTAFEDARLVERTANACFDGVFRLQDRGLMLSSLMGGRHSRAIAWPILRDRWDTHIAPLDPGLKHRVIGGLGQLTPRDLEREATAFLQEKQAPDSAEITAQTLERLRLNAAAAERLAGELDEALAVVDA
jgi:puromycin-sensitive aminopeptidase